MKLGLALSMTGSRSNPVKPWETARASLRTYINANYNQPNPHNQAVMPSPPTITASTTQPSGLTQEKRYSNSAPEVRYYGGANVAFSTVYRRFPTATIFSSGGNVGSGKQAVAWRAKTRVTAAKVSVRVLGGTVPYRFIVDGRYVSLAGSLTSTTSGTNYFQLDFGSSATRTIMVESEQANAFDAFGAASGDTFSVISTTPKRMIVFGDSFAESTGATCKYDGAAYITGDMLGIEDLWSSGVGGTGYVNTVSGTKYKASERLADINSNGPWDIISVEMGINDIGLSTATITSEVNTCLTSIRANNPSAQIFVVGAWDKNAPAAPVANYAATKAAIIAGIPANSGIVFLDPEGVAYTKADGTHPDGPGYVTLATWRNTQMRNAIGL